MCASIHQILNMDMQLTFYYICVKQQKKGVDLGTRPVSPARRLLSGDNNSISFYIILLQSMFTGNLFIKSSCK